MVQVLVRQPPDDVQVVAVHKQARAVNGELVVDGGGDRALRGGVGPTRDVSGVVGYRCVLLIYK